MLGVISDQSVYPKPMPAFLPERGWPGTRRTPLTSQLSSLPVSPRQKAYQAHLTALQKTCQGCCSSLQNSSRVVCSRSLRILICFSPLSNVLLLVSSTLFFLEALLTGRPFLKKWGLEEILSFLTYKMGIRSFSQGCEILIFRIMQLRMNQP